VRRDTQKREKGLGRTKVFDKVDPVKKKDKERKRNWMNSAAKRWSKKVFCLYQLPKRESDPKENSLSPSLSTFQKRRDGHSSAEVFVGNEWC